MPAEPDAAREFRRIPPDRAVDFQECVDYAFSPESGPPEYEGPDDLPTRQGEKFGVFVGDDLVSVCSHYDFEARLRGDWVPMAGLAAVATPPEHRREGHVRFAVEESLDRWRGSHPIAALWPFDRAYYAQFGWATANKSITCTLPVEQLAFAREYEDGEFRRLDPDDWQELVAVHEAHAADRNLTLRRDEEWWRERVFDAFGDDRPHLYAWERDGAVRGYLRYEFESTGGGMSDRRLKVTDMAFADHEAYLHLLGFLADHDSQASEVRLSSELETSILDLVPEPGAVHCEARAGPMVRVVDVGRALSALSYPADATADLTLAVTDETAPWNDDAFRLRVAEGHASVERVRDDAEPGSVDATLDVGTLSQVIVGYHGVADARRLADLSVASESVAADLAALFPESTVYLREFF